MVFSSPVFLFLFLPVCLAVDFACGVFRLRTARNYSLLAFSLLFYSFGEGAYVLVMIASILINYAFGLLLSVFTYRRLVLGLGLATNLALLAHFKYQGFLIDNLNILLGTDILSDPVHLPIGISFFTFQAITYLFDVYDRRVHPQKDPFDVGLYIALFPQLVAGPIVRYETVAEQIHNRNPTLEDAASGFRLFCIGLFQKVVLADTLAKIVDVPIEHVPAHEFGTPMAWLVMTSYTLQIFFDFAGYSLMAIGLGRALGFTFPENFNQPYTARSIREFWRRWHISLSTWFRDYVYIRLGGNRGSEIATYRNLLIVFFLTGIWHGASWNFVVWGLFHGVFIMLERLPAFGNVLGRLPSPLQRCYLLCVVIVGWVFFRFEALDEAISIISVMAVWTPTLPGTSILADPRYYLDAWTVTVLLAAAIWALSPPSMADRVALALERAGALFKENVLNFGSALMLLISVGLVVSGTYTAFIYFRF